MKINGFHGRLARASAPTRAPVLRRKPRRTRPPPSPRPAARAIPCRMLGRILPPRRPMLCPAIGLTMRPRALLLAKPAEGPGVDFVAHVLAFVRLTVLVTQGPYSPVPSPVRHGEAHDDEQAEPEQDRPYGVVVLRYQSRRHVRLLPSARCGCVGLSSRPSTTVPRSWRHILPRGPAKSSMVSMSSLQAWSPR